MKIDDMASIGRRLVSDGHIATVKYVGEVRPTKGVWLGVEWDDPTRGKHNGSHEGIQYFTTSHPKSGSFIREKKASFGCSVIEAVNERYGLVEGDNAGVDMDEMFVLGEGNKLTTVEVVGAQSVNRQQCQFDRLIELGLRDSQVRDGGREGDISNLIPSVRQLDLSKNLLITWAQVAQIVEQLKRMFSLNISENKLIFPETSSDLSNSFTQVQVLYLNRMNYTWNEILKCTEIIRHLKQIHACFNQITSVPDIGPNMDKISLINLESNPLGGWEEVSKFAKLENLDTLILNDTGLEGIEIPDVPAGQKSNLFLRLKSLSISNNKIGKWRSINELNKLKSFSELYFKRNPLHNDYPDDTMPRSMALGKIANLEYYNRSQVLATERRGAELDYLKSFGRHWKKSGGHQDPAQNKPNVDFTQEHPRYQDLINKYGPVEDYELLQQTTALKNSLISVMIESQQVPDKPPVKKKLPVTMTVQKLKLLVQRLYRVNPNTMTITYTSTKMKGPEIELESDQKEIGFYSVEEGDTLHIKWN